jgi:hypothetical protein
LRSVSLRRAARARYVRACTCTACGMRACATSSFCVRPPPFVSLRATTHTDQVVANRFLRELCRQHDARVAAWHDARLTADQKDPPVREGEHKDGDDGGGGDDDDDDDEDDDDRDDHDDRGDDDRGRSAAPSSGAGIDSAGRASGASGPGAVSGEGRRRSARGGGKGSVCSGGSGGSRNSRERSRGTGRGEGGGGSGGRGRLRVDFLALLDPIVLGSASTGVIGQINHAG